jgi:hypothetical protein
MLKLVYNKLLKKEKYFLYVIIKKNNIVYCKKINLLSHNLVNKKRNDYQDYI